MLLAGNEKAPPRLELASDQIRQCCVSRCRENTRLAREADGMVQPMPEGEP
jgi:hypothetical protein